MGLDEGQTSSQAGQAEEAGRRCAGLKCISGLWSPCCVVLVRPRGGSGEAPGAHTVPAVATEALCPSVHWGNGPNLQERPSSGRGGVSKGGSEMLIPCCSFSRENFIWGEGARVRVNAERDRKPR